MSERIVRIIMGLVLIGSVGALHMGVNFFIASGIIGIVGILLLIWGIFNFCLMERILRKILPSKCECGSCK